jgi:hypothetical protein
MRRRTTFPTQHAWLEGRRSQMVLAWRRRARGHGWPESATRSRCGSTGARRPATRQGHPTAHPNAVGARQRSNQGGGKRKRAAVVLTSGRWCSRGRLEDGRWRGEGVRGGVGVHGGVNVPASVRLLLPTRTTSSPLLVSAVVVVVLGVSTASRCGRSFPRLDAAAARLLPPSLSACSLVKKGKPQWGLVAWALGSRPRPTFEARCRGRRMKAPNCPGSDRSGGRGGAPSSAPTSMRGCAMRGQKGEVPLWGQARFTCARAPAPRRAGQPGGRASDPPRAWLLRGSPGAAASEAGER